VDHAIGYLFGVLIVILAVNFFPRIFRIDVENEMKQNATGKNHKETDFDLIAFAFAAIFGYTLGKIENNLTFIGLGYFSLGSTGGVLVGALILGYIGRIGFMNFRMNSKAVGVVAMLVGFKIHLEAYALNILLRQRLMSETSYSQLSFSKPSKFISAQCVASMAFSLDND